jgi:hypothetical protein
MMENIIALAVGIVVVGGLLSLVYRILTGGNADQRLDQELARLALEKNGDSSAKDTASPAK